MPARVLWPERESLYDLMLLRASIGHAAFESEKQNNPVNPEACEWPAEYFERADFWFQEWPEQLTVKALALDPSKGATDKPGDYAAYVRYGRDHAGREYVEADLRRADADALIAAGLEHVRAFNPDGFAIEANVFQSLLAPLFKLAVAADFDAAKRIRGNQAAPLELRLYLLDNSVNKAVRIRRWTDPLAQRRVRFKARSPGTALLVQQLRDFPNGEHDDGPDAGELARRLAVELFNGRQRPRQRGWRA